MIAIARGVQKEPYIKNLMKTLQIDREEAEAIYNSDMEIEHEQPQDFDLSAEKQAVVKMYTRTGTRQASPKQETVYQFDKKPRKENVGKSNFIAELADFLASKATCNITDVKIINKEREVEFKFCGEWHKLTFSYQRNKNKAEASK